MAADGLRETLLAASLTNKLKFTGNFLLLKRSS